MADNFYTSSSKTFRFIRAGAAILILAVIFDWLIGSLLGYLFFHQRVGDIADTNYAIFKSQAQVFVFGGSLAKRHYDTRIFDDTLKMDTYNAGHDAQSLFYDLLLTRIISKQHHPSLVVLELGSKELYFKGYAADGFDALLPYCRVFPKEASFILDLKNKRAADTSEAGQKLWPFNTERLKMVSRMYPYNSQVVLLIAGYNGARQSHSGFSPVFGAITEARRKALYSQDSIANIEQKHLDAGKVNALKQIFKIIHDSGIKMVIARSPNFYPENSSEADNVIKQLCEKYKVPFFDHSKDTTFDNMSLFHDNHLNNTGAKLYSMVLSHQVKNYLQNSVTSK